MTTRTSIPELKIGWRSLAVSIFFLTVVIVLQSEAPHEESPSVNGLTGQALPAPSQHERASDDRLDEAKAKVPSSPSESASPASVPLESVHGGTNQRFNEASQTPAPLLANTSASSADAAAEMTYNGARQLFGFPARFSAAPPRSASIQSSSAPPASLKIETPSLASSPLPSASVQPAPNTQTILQPVPTVQVITTDSGTLRTDPALMAQLPAQDLPLVEASLQAEKTMEDNSAPSEASPASPNDYEVTVWRDRPQVVLEQRIGPGWKPVASRHVRMKNLAVTQKVEFQLPAGANRGDYRTVTYSNAKFPGSFTEGAIEFGTEARSYAGDLFYSGGIVLLSGGVMTSDIISHSSSSTTMSLSATSVTAATTTTAPVEPDIWQIVGSRLFFFNQYRGLQVVDLTNPAAPVKTGTLRLSAAGVEMFALDAEGSLLALIAKGQAYADQNTPTQIHIIRVTNGVPGEIACLSVADYYEDSRLMGGQIHLITSPSSWRSLQNGLGWSNYGQQNGARLVTVDLSSPEHPVILSEHTLNGYAPKLQAVGDKLSVATSAEFNDGSLSSKTQVSALSVFHTAPAAVPLKTLALKGTVLDKFKMSVVGDAVAVVTQSLNDWGLHTWVETYPLSGPETTALAIKEIPGAVRETLHATRFHGTRAYIVTFRQTDPLFIVDLADPAQPRVTGKLVIPGWSTYLEPRGDQLLAVGVEDRRVTASLFDVHDPAVPTLLSRLALGTASQSSWSEANYDEKAVEFLPAENLLLMPFQVCGWDADRRWSCTNAMQAIDVGVADLTLGETIPHNFPARRGTVINGYIVSISDRELVVVDRSHIAAAPVVQMSMSWNVDRVVPFGDYLVQIENGSQSSPMLRVTTSANPDGLIEEIEPGTERIQGIERRGNDLFVAQWILRTTTTGSGGATTEHGLRTWRFDLSAPPEVRETGRAETWFGDRSSEYSAFVWQQLAAVWPSDDRLVWHVATSWSSVVTLIPVSIGINTLAAEAPVEIRGSDHYSLSAPLAQNGFVLWSHQAAQKPHAPNAGDGNAASPLPASSTTPPTPTAGLAFGVQETGALPVSSPILVIDQPITISLPVISAPITWSGSSSSSWTVLSVVDFNQPVPVVRDPVPLPGKLVAVSDLDAQGGIVVTMDAGSQVRTLAYDGVACWSFDDPVLNGPVNEIVANEDAVFTQWNSSYSRIDSFSYNLTSRAYELRDAWVLPDDETRQLQIREGILFTRLAGSTNVHLHAAQLGSRGQMTNRSSATLAANDWHRLDDLAVPDPNGFGVFIPYGAYGVEFAGWDAAP